MNVPRLLLILERHRNEILAQDLMVCLNQYSDVWTAWDTEEAIIFLSSYLHGRPVEMTTEQRKALDKIEDSAGCTAIRVLSTAIRQMKTKE